MNIKQKIKLHDRLYRHADRLIKKYNPCEVKNGKCLDGDFCCGSCEHLTENGCSVNCLSCKLHLCWMARAKFYTLNRTLERMSQKACYHNILGIRQSREQVIKKLQSWENLDLKVTNGSSST